MLGWRLKKLTDRAIRKRSVSAVSEITLDPIAAAKLAKLRHVSDDMPGITRHKARHGFDYRLPDGELLRDLNILQRIRSLGSRPPGLRFGSAPMRTATFKQSGETSAGASSIAIIPAGVKSGTSRNTERC